MCAAGAGPGPYLQGRFDGCVVSEGRWTLRISSPCSVCTRRADAPLPTSQFPTSPLPPCQPCRLTQACLAALDFIVTSSARYNVEDGTLTLELQQLGLPRSNSNSVARAYRDGRERLREALGRAVVRVRILSVPGSASCSDGGHVPSPILLSTVPGPLVPPPSLPACSYQGCRLCLGGWIALWAPPSSTTWRRRVCTWTLGRHTACRGGLPAMGLLRQGQGLAHLRAPHFPLTWGGTSSVCCTLSC